MRCQSDRTWALEADSRRCVTCPIRLCVRQVRASSEPDVDRGDEAASFPVHAFIRPQIAIRTATQAQERPKSVAFHEVTTATGLCFTALWSWSAGFSKLLSARTSR